MGVALFVCLVALLEVTAAPFLVSAPWYMAQGSIILGTVFALVRRVEQKPAPISGAGRRPRQPRPLEEPQVKRAA